jgi:hypothetical protein
MDEQDLDLGLSADERVDLTAIGDLIEDRRPVPRAAFRGDLRRLLIERTPTRRGAAAAERWRVLVATYSALGTLLLAVAAIGLAGVGPFSA